jgi:Putative peptidoglycan binding domain
VQTDRQGGIPASETPSLDVKRVDQCIVQLSFGWSERRRLRPALNVSISSRSLVELDARNDIMQSNLPNDFAVGSQGRAIIAEWQWRAALLVLLSWFLFGISEAKASGRVALVLVAEDYEKLQSSAVGVKRGSDIADALTAHGFDVLLSSNPTNSSARAALRDFSMEVPTADLAIAVLIGHGSAWGGQSFFLPSNSVIERAPDLLSRGISITNIAQIVARAKNGGVFFFMTIPNYGAVIDGLDARPQFAANIGKTVFTVFSGSAKIPVSRIDTTSEQAADALVAVLRQPAPMLSDAVKAASGDAGMIIGSVTDVSLAKPSPSPSPPVTAAGGAAATTDQDKKADTERKLEAERIARDAAEKRAREQQAKTEQAQAEAQRAQAEAEKAQAETRKAQAEAEKAKSEAKQVEAQAELERRQVEKPSSPAAPVDEAQLGQKLRERIQLRLKKMGLYTGAIDAIMGPLTREAIMGYQKSRGAAVTGYLTPEQFQTMLSDDQ